MEITKMATTNISYQDFKPDWWDAVGISAEAVKAQIGSITESAFGPVGISAIQMQSMVDSIFANYQGQQALKAAANAAQEATRYADLPNSPLYLNAIATQASSENIAAQWFAQSTQIMKNTELNSIMVGNATRLASALGPTINTIQLGVAVVSGDESANSLRMVSQKPM